MDNILGYLEDFWNSFGGQITTYVVAAGGVGAIILRIGTTITTLVKTNKDALTELKDANKEEINDLKEQIIELKELIVVSNTERAEADEVRAQEAAEARASEIDDKQEELLALINSSREEL